MYEGDNRARFLSAMRIRTGWCGLDGIDFVVHAAATKIVPTAEYNPFESRPT